MIAAWKNKIVQTASRIGASWLLAIGILLGAQSAIAIIASAHDGGGSSYTPQSSAPAKFVELHDLYNGEPIYINLSAATGIQKGNVDDKEGTFIWFGGSASAVKETPEEVMKALESTKGEQAK